jgi:hypothetical protein
VIQDDFTVAHTRNLEVFASLSFDRDHSIRVSNVRYQRELWIPPERTVDDIAATPALELPAA